MLNRVCLQENVRITGEHTFTCGDHVHIGAGTEIQAEGGVHIGSNVGISYNCVIWTINHNYEADVLPIDFERIRKPVVINDNVWIGRNVLITGGVHIGEGAVIGMGSVVTKNIPPLAVAGGNPARVIKFRSMKKYVQLRDAGALLKNQGEGCMFCGTGAAEKYYLSDMEPKPRKTLLKKLFNPIILRVKQMRVMRSGFQL